MKTIAGYVVLTCKYHREGKQWVGVCEELGTSTFAPTIEESQKELQELVILHLNTLEKVGERERFFTENNIRLRAVKPKEPVAIRISPEQNNYVAPCIYPVMEMAAVA